MRSPLKSAGIFALVFAPLTVLAADMGACTAEASRKFNIPVAVLNAIARVESGGRPRVVGPRNADGTYDYGFMGINSSHLPKLAEYGISRNDLFDPCVSLHVGAWILSGAVAQHGWNWNAIGAYNVGCRRLADSECARRRHRYASKVYAAMTGSARVSSDVAARVATPKKVRAGILSIELSSSAEVPVEETIATKDEGLAAPSIQSQQVALLNMPLEDDDDEE